MHDDAGNDFHDNQRCHLKIEIIERILTLKMYRPHETMHKGFKFSILSNGPGTEPILYNTLGENEQQICVDDPNSFDTSH